MDVKGDFMVLGTKGNEIIEVNVTSNPPKGALIMQGHYNGEL